MIKIFAPQHSNFIYILCLEIVFFLLFTPLSILDTYWLYVLSINCCFLSTDKLYLIKQFRRHLFFIWSFSSFSFLVMVTLFLEAWNGTVLESISLECFMIHIKSGFGDRNEAGNSILGFVVSYDMTLANTWFRKIDSHLIIYRSGGNASQIDLFLTRRVGRNCCIDCKVILRECVATQHQLLVLDVRLRRV